MKTPEGKIKDKIKAVLDKHGCYRFMPVQMGIGERALDFFICHFGYFIAVEAKAPGKDLTAVQRLCQKRIIAAGGTVLRVSNEVELAALDRILTQIAARYQHILDAASRYPANAGD